jgi:hypothetical protein
MIKKLHDNGADSCMYILYGYEAAVIFAALDP